VVAGQARGWSNRLYQCTRGAWPVSSSAVRRSPNSCTSSAPKVEAPTSEIQTGSGVRARISASRSGHSWICQWFQSSGKPCTATASTTSSTPLALHVAHEARVDGGDPAQHPGQPRTLRRDGGRRQLDHAREA
jgi:hypothetical protein